MNFYSERNSMYFHEIENEEDNRHTNDIKYCYSEINRKNKKILELKSIISNLKSTQETLLNEIISLQNKDTSKTKKKDTSQNNNEQELILLSKIKKLENENSKLKMRINKSEEKEKIFYNNINNKLLKAERDIELLSFENKNNNNIILAIQNFLFNISDKINTEKQTLIFDLSLIDNNTFIHNLQILELNILKKIKQLNNIGNMCLNNSRNNYKEKIKDIEADNYYRKHNTIIINNDKDNNNKIKNIKKMAKFKNRIKTINYINSQNQKGKAELGFGLFYNNFFNSKKHKNIKPLKAYGLENNFLNKIGINDDIIIENKSIKISDDSKENIDKNIK